MVARMQPTRTVKMFTGTRDNEGRLVFGDPQEGCAFCGSVSAKVAENGKAVWYHPSTDCCVQQVALQARKKEL